MDAGAIPVDVNIHRGGGRVSTTPLVFNGVKNESAKNPN